MLGCCSLLRLFFNFIECLFLKVYFNISPFIFILSPIDFCLSKKVFILATVDSLLFNKSVPIWWYIKENADQ